MKRIITLLIAIAVISGLSTAQAIKPIKVTEGGTATSISIPDFQPNTDEIVTPKYSGDMPMGSIIVDEVQDAVYSFYGQVTPVVYEPKSKTLIIVQNKRFNNNNGKYYDSVYYKSSQDKGATWKKRLLQNKKNILPVWPSIAVSNPNNETNPDKFNYVIASPIAVPKDGKFPWQGVNFVIADGSDGNVGDLNSIYATTGQRWFWTRAVSNMVSGNNIFYNVGTLASDKGYQYGYYGSSIYNTNLGDFVKQESPAQWGLDKFKPSESIDKSPNDHIRIDVDNAGNAYAAVKNIFVSDQNNRVPAVSKTTDGGDTWGDFDKMPATLMRTYYSTMGGNPAYSFILPFKTDGFVVWGVDKWSFFFPVIVKKEKKDKNAKFHFVEAFKANGAWGIRKVGEWSGLQQITMQGKGSGSNVKETISTSWLGSELQIVRTADNKYLVAKWVDYINDSLKIEPEITIYDTKNNPMKLKVIQSNDVFMTYRDITKTEWKPVKNVTNNKSIDKCTYLPMIIPDLQHIPLFQLVSKKLKYKDPNNPRNQYPLNAWSFIIDGRQDLVLNTINLTTVDVEEEENLNFNVNDIYPNPATDFAEFTFNLDNSSNVVIEVYNALGQKVSSVLNQNLSAGLNGVNINVSNLLNGTYYVRMTSNGHSITKTMTVVH